MCYECQCDFQVASLTFPAFERAGPQHAMKTESHLCAQARGLVVRSGNPRRATCGFSHTLQPPDVPCLSRPGRGLATQHLFCLAGPSPLRSSDELPLMTELEGPAFPAEDPVPARGSHRTALRGRLTRWHLLLSRESQGTPVLPSLTAPSTWQERGSGNAARTPSLCYSEGCTRAAKPVMHTTHGD